MDERRQKRNLIPLKKALERGGFGRTKAYRLINEGKIVAYKMEGQTMVNAEFHRELPYDLTPHRTGQRLKSHVRSDRRRAQNRLAHFFT